MRQIGECLPRNGMICRRFYPGDSRCTTYGGKALCLVKPDDIAANEATEASLTAIEAGLGNQNQKGE